MNTTPCINTIGHLLMSIRRSCPELRMRGTTPTQMSLVSPSPSASYVSPSPRVPPAAVWHHEKNMAKAQCVTAVKAATKERVWCSQLQRPATLVCCSCIVRLPGGASTSALCSSAKLWELKVHGLVNVIGGQVHQAGTGGAPPLPLRQPKRTSHAPQHDDTQLPAW